jgi:hypothetical protein
MDGISLGFTVAGVVVVVVAIVGIAGYIVDKGED